MARTRSRSAKGPSGIASKLDYLTIAGILLALAAVVGGNLLEGGHTASLVQLTAFVIVFGGTLGAILVQTPLPVFLLALKRLRWIFVPPPLGGPDSLKAIVSWSRVVRKDGLLGLQKVADVESEAFTRKGLELLVDGSEPDVIRKILELEIDSAEARGYGAARVYEAMGGYSPTIGIIGAVMGLIHVMQNLTDPSTLGPGIAVAFVATIYGVGFANFLFLPIASKLKIIVESQSQYQEMLIDGLVAIAEGENPRIIESKLESYVRQG